MVEHGVTQTSKLSSEQKQRRVLYHDTISHSTLESEILETLSMFRDQYDKNGTVPQMVPYDEL